MWPLLIVLTDVAASLLTLPHSACALPTLVWGALSVLSVLLLTCSTPQVILGFLTGRSQKTVGNVQFTVGLSLQVNEC